MALVEIKKSKFISLCFEVKSAEDVSNILETIKKENKKATHVCFAYRIENDENKLVKTFGGQNGKVTYTLPQSNKESKFFLVSKIKNFSTNEEVSSDNSNIVHFLGKEAKTTQISQKRWYI